MTVEELRSEIDNLCIDLLTATKRLNELDSLVKTFDDSDNLELKKTYTEEYYIIMEQHRVIMMNLRARINVYKSLEKELNLPIDLNITRVSRELAKVASISNV